MMIAGGTAADHVLTSDGYRMWRKEEKPDDYKRRSSV